MRPLILSFCLFFFYGHVHAQVVPPTEPADPQVEETRDPVQGTRAKEHGRRILAVFADRTTNKGTVYFPREEIVFRFRHNNLDYERPDNIRNLAVVEFLRWKGTAGKDETEYVFYPVVVRVTTRDGAKFRCLRNIKEFNKLPYTDALGESFLYTYFYEYREGSRWRNCGREEMDYPEQHPPGGCVVRLIFMEE